MIIAHNMLALNAFNKLNKNNRSSSLSSERISSGLRIGKASDDAAGLAISEKMRAQIRGIDMAARNSQDGISLIQTAEGGMSEVHSLVQRMRELTVQGATDTLSKEDRNAVQTEINQLKSEISNIANNTEFNNIKLLDGSISDNISSVVTKDIVVTPNVSIPGDGTIVNTNVNVDGVDLKFSFTNTGINNVKIDVESDGTILGTANIIGVPTEIAPTVQWQKSFGGSNNELGMNVQQTNDGGYIVSGMTSSNDGDISVNNGSADYEIVKLDSSGNVSWSKTIGGASNDYPYSIKQTSDGGYVIAGYKNSDAYITKLDSNGNIQWDKLISTSSTYTSIQQTSDGGYILSGGDTYDARLMKTDSSGNIIWEKSYGGMISTDFAAMVQETSDGGFIFTGATYSPDISGYHNGTFPILYNDVYVTKVNSSGNLQWQKALGGNAYDGSGAIQQTSDGGYLIVGTTNSIDGDITYNHGDDDVWLIKLSSTGNIDWKKTYGGSEYDRAYDFDKTSDGGFIVLGSSVSIDGDVSNKTIMDEDIWLLKLDSSGNIKWDKSYGGSGNDWTSGFGDVIQQTSDGGFVLIGSSISNDGDVTGNHGGSDMWIAKLSAPATDPSLPVTEAIIINEAESEDKTIEFEDARVTFNNSTLDTAVKIQLKVKITNNNVKDNGLILQVGPNTGQVMHVPIDSMKPNDLGLIDGIPDVTTSIAANSSLSYLDNAMQKVSTGRSKLGSKHNALEHIISNLNNSSENLVAAESRIRDVDIAKEIINLTKSNILSQATSSILSQANQFPEKILQLLEK